jgi:hypothetical protein
MDSAIKCPKQMTAAEEIRRLCESINEKAHELEKLAMDKLSPLYIANPPRAGCLENTKNSRLYPPYFDGLKHLLDTALSALDETSRTINKVDI